MFNIPSARILFPYIAYRHDDLCRFIRDYFQSFGSGCRIIRRAKFLEEVRHLFSRSLTIVGLVDHTTTFLWLALLSNVSQL